jgi:glycosyltransferase involved in cell wall biosynthesis
MKPPLSNPKLIEKFPRLMLFDLAVGGHHGNYIQHLIDYARKTAFAGAIDIVVLPEFLDLHKETVEAISGCRHPTVNLISISPEEYKALGPRHSGISRTLRNFREWQVFCKYAKELQTTQALMMYLDTYELPLAFGMRSPCPVSGIYFRPTFHYSTFASYQPSQKERLQQIRERITLRKILQHPQLQTIFCLDPFAVHTIDPDCYKVTMVHLADPVQPHPLVQSDSATLRAKLGIEQHRQVFLLFGALDHRKGIYQLLDAIQLLAPELCQSLCLLLVGKPNSMEQTQIQHKIAVLRHTHPVQLIECYDFVPENEVPNYFKLTDIVLATYQRHVGMSGILLLAAAAGKPVLSSNYGLMGELIRRYKLGLGLDSTLPTEIANGLTQCLIGPVDKLCDHSQMELFAKQHAVENYTRVIFHHLNLLPTQASSILRRAL